MNLPPELLKSVTPASGAVDAEIGRIVRAQIAMRMTWKEAHITPGQVDTDYILRALQQIEALARTQSRDQGEGS